MDLIDALWYGAVTPGEVLEKQDEKQKALARLMERNRAELAALHPEAGAILEKLEGNQAELRDYEARLVFRSFVAERIVNAQEAAELLSCSVLSHKWCVVFRVDLPQLLYAVDIGLVDALDPPAAPVVTAGAEFAVPFPFIKDEGFLELIFLKTNKQSLQTLHCLQETPDQSIPEAYRSLR